MCGAVQLCVISQDAITGGDGFDTQQGMPHCACFHAFMCCGYTVCTPLIDQHFNIPDYPSDQIKGK